MKSKKKLIKVQTKVDTLSAIYNDSIDPWFIRLISLSINLIPHTTH